MIDAELIVTTALLADAGVTTIVERRVGTELPARPVFPAVRLTRIGGTAIDPESDHVEAALLQLDAFGETKAQAFDLVNACRVALRAVTGVQPAGVVSTIRFGSVAWVPDDNFTPARSRYALDLTVYAHA